MARRGAGRSARQPGPGGPKGAPRASYHHGNLRQALVAAALRLVETQGVAGLTLRAAARRAGVSQAAPYRHFADKQALLAAVAEEGFRTLTAEMRQAQAAQADVPVTRFQALGLAYVGFARSHPSHFRVMFGRETADRAAHPELRAAADDCYQLLLEAIRECQGEGQARDAAAEEMAVAAWATVHGLAALLVDGQLAGRGGPPADVARVVTDHLFLGLGPR